MSLESQFQADLIDDLEDLFDGCEIIKNDSGYQQGLPDLLVLYKDKWAMLEVKRSATAPERPNQRYWIETFNEMSFGAFVYPENKEHVLHELQRAFSAARKARVPFRQ